MSRSSQQNRKRVAQKRRKQRVGGHIESLEQRQLMFADALTPIDLVLPDGVVPQDQPADMVDISHGDHCIDFEDLPGGASYVVGDTFVADNTGLQAKITGAPFTWSNGVVTVAGVTTVDNANMAGHVGQDMAVNNIVLDFDFGGPVVDLRLRFGEFGGNLNLEINGDFKNFQDFQDVHGAVIGGTTVTVPVGGTGQDRGQLNVTGVVHSFKVGGQELWVDHVCVARHVEYRFDYGDAPDQPYPTLAVNNGARHRVDPNVFLGRIVDAEADGQPTFNSDGDDAHPAAVTDDEDGVRFLTPLVPGSTAEVEVIASTEGWLNAWIDFDRDGIWSGGSENIFSAVPLSAGVNVLTFAVPADAKPDPDRATYSRWRFSTTDRFLRPQQPGDAIPNGEVEDHLVYIQRQDPDVRLDYGDAPDGPYPTLASSDGARHVVNREVHLGQRIDAEPDGQPTFLANGDDYSNADDEDGVVFVTPFVPGKDGKAEVLASVDGHLDAWIDFDQDGKWSPDEQIAVSQPMTAGGNVVEFHIPRDATPQPTRPTYARFRFSLQGGLKPTGIARDGEVEDYLLLNGDLNDDGRITADDVDLLCRAIHAGDSRGDVNGDGVVDDKDMDYLIHDILGTHYGDANLDGLFNSADLIQVFRAGEYEDDVPHNSGWAEGDFNCDGEFDSADLIKALQDGAYSESALPLLASLVADEALGQSDGDADSNKPGRHRWLFEL